MEVLAQASYLVSLRQYTFTLGRDAHAGDIIYVRAGDVVSSAYIPVMVPREQPIVWLLLNPRDLPVFCHHMVKAKPAHRYRDALHAAQSMFIEDDRTYKKRKSAKQLTPADLLV